MPGGSETAETAATGPADAEVAEVERALSRLSYLLTRAHRNDLITAAAGVPLDRAAVVVLRHLAVTGPARPGEIADALDVEAPHITRQVHKLQQAGYVQRVADPGDHRAQLVKLTGEGKEASARLAEKARHGIADALVGWQPEDLRRLATLLSRMLDDFVSHSGADTPPAPRGL